MVILKDERSSHCYYIINNGAIIEIQNGTVKDSLTGVTTRLSFFYQHEGEAVHLKFSEVVGEMQNSKGLDSLNVTIGAETSVDNNVKKNVRGRFIEEMQAFKSLMLEKAGLLIDMGRLLQDKFLQKGSVTPNTGNNERSILERVLKEPELLKLADSNHIAEMKRRQIEEKERKAMANSPSKVKYKSLFGREISIDNERMDLISKFARKNTDFIEYKGRTRVSPDTFDKDLNYCNIFVYKLTPMVVLELTDLVGLMEEINGQTGCVNEKRVFAANLGLIDTKLKEFMDCSPRQSRRLENLQKKKINFGNNPFAEHMSSSSEVSESWGGKKKDTMHASRSIETSANEISNSDSKENRETRKKHCEKHTGSQQQQNCGKCSSCTNINSHRICKMRCCQQLNSKKRPRKHMDEDDDSRYSLNPDSCSDGTPKRARKDTDNVDDSRYSLNPNKSSNELPKLKIRHKRCRECSGCKRKYVCGVCKPCLNKNFHQVCRLRRCEKLIQKKVSNAHSSILGPLRDSNSSLSSDSSSKALQNSLKKKRSRKDMDNADDSRYSLNPNKSSNESSKKQFGKLNRSNLLNSTSESEFEALSKRLKKSIDRRTQENPRLRASMRLNRVQNDVHNRHPEDSKTSNRVRSPTPYSQPISVLVSSSENSDTSEKRRMLSSSKNDTTPNRQRSRVSIMQRSKMQSKDLDTSSSSAIDEFDKLKKSPKPATKETSKESPRSKKSFKIMYQFGDHSLDKMRKHSDELKKQPVAERKSIAGVNAYSDRRINLFYKVREDKKIIKWVLKDNHATKVSGNAIWKDLEAKEFTENGKPVRTWQSLRNRFLKYILLNLSDYGLSKDEEKEIRVAACIGCIKRRKSNMSKKNLPGFSPPSEPSTSRGHGDAAAMRLQDPNKSIERFKRDVMRYALNGTKIEKRRRKLFTNVGFF